jgi:hypothetical protein
MEGINWTARRERARAFIAQQRKPGRAWSTLTYSYDKEQDDATTNGQDSTPDSEPQGGAGAAQDRAIHGARGAAAVDTDG